MPKTPPCRHADRTENPLTKALNNNAKTTEIKKENYLATDETPYVRGTQKVGRNDPCPCGSGKKFKKCCMGKGSYDEA